MLDRALLEQKPGRFQISNDQFIGFFVKLAGIRPAFFRKLTLVIDRRDYPEIVFPSNYKVFLPVPGSGMDAAGALIERNVLA